MRMEQKPKVDNSFFSRGIVNDANYITEGDDAPEAPEDTGIEAQSCCGAVKTEDRGLTPNRT